MPLSTLSPLLAEARARGGALVGQVCLSWEDAVEFVAAGEATGIPVILSAGPGARRHMPLSIWGSMFRHLAEGASVPVVAHLDHGTSVAEVEEALAAGFSSVMFDGSALPLAENVRITQRVVELAHTARASVEAEVGYVGYSGGAASEGTDPEHARVMATETGIDCLAVSVGNVHLSPAQDTPLNFDRLAAVRAVTDLPLVIHGGSGVPLADRERASREFGVAKINVGTEVRQAFDTAVRSHVQAETGMFDRLDLARAVSTKRAPVLQGLLKAAWN